jgi:hypothetical protein
VDATSQPSGAHVVASTEDWRFLPSLLHAASKATLTASSTAPLATGIDLTRAAIGLLEACEELDWASVLPVAAPASTGTHPRSLDVPPDESAGLLELIARATGLTTALLNDAPRPQSSATSLRRVLGTLDAALEHLAELHRDDDLR